MEIKNDIYRCKNWLDFFEHYDVVRDKTFTISGAWFNVVTINNLSDYVHTPVDEIKASMFELHGWKLKEFKKKFFSSAPDFALQTPSDHLFGLICLS